MEILLGAILIGLIPASISKSKGYSFGLWWIYGALLFIVALPHALIIRRNTYELERQQLSEGMKKCPYCAELIKDEARICRFCGNEITPSEPKASKWRQFTSDSRRILNSSASEWRCPYCAQMNAVSVTICSKCGK